MSMPGYAAPASGGGDETTDYVGNMIYENGTLKHILVDGGYYDPKESKYVYYLSDHLGNNRVVANQNAEVKQVSHYYPFGMAFADGIRQSDNPYKYNGKELDNKHGLNWYDYSARHMDGVRFTSADPLAEKYYSFSPYVYCMNNPIFYTDPTGMSSDPPEWMKQFASGFGSGLLGMAEGVANSGFPIGGLNTGLKEADKVINAFNEGGLAAAGEQYVNSLAETSGAVGLNQTLGGVADGDPKAIGAATAAVATFIVAKKAGNSTGAKGSGVAQEAAASSKYEISTTARKSTGNRSKSSSTPNVDTNVTKTEFGNNLEKSGYSKTPRGGGKVMEYKKGDKKYVTRDNAKSTGGATADYYRDGAKEVTKKIRLGE